MATGETEQDVLPQCAEHGRKELVQKIKIFRLLPRVASTPPVQGPELRKPATAGGLIVVSAFGAPP